MGKVRTGGALVLGLAVFMTGCGVRVPASLETKIVYKVKRNITVRGRGESNPLSANEENIRHGRKNFATYCMVCHGLDGQNTGVPFAERMSPPVPPLTSPLVQSYSDGQLKWVIDHGIFPSGMPASKGILGDDEIWQIVTYLRHLPPKGSLGEPAVYGGQPVEPATKKENGRSN
jgi:S-disulfanyl-L-cysteine oxidoreductase SoxD